MANRRRAWVAVLGCVGVLVAPAFAGAPPSNDLCDNASGPLAVPSSTAGQTTVGTIDNAPVCGTTITAPGVWYTVTGTGNTMTASTCNAANFDTKISVFCDSCDELTCVVGLDDAGGCAGFTTLVSWCSEVGATYRILVHGFGSATGSFTLSLSDSGTPCTGAVACSETLPAAAAVPAVSPLGMVLLGLALLLTGTGALLWKRPTRGNA